MAIKVTCGSCGREMNVKDALAGKKGKCPGCGGIIEVPMPETPVEAAPEPPQTPPEPAAAEEEMKPCVHCGKPLPVNAVFCVHCGTHLRTGKKHDVEETDEGAEDYDFFKVAPDMITAPMPTIALIAEKPVSNDNLKKAIIFFAIGVLLMSLVAPKIASEEAIQNGLKGTSLKLWHFPLFLVLALLAVVIDLVICSVAGSMFGTSGVALPNVFVSVLAVRAITGMAMLVPALLIFSLKGGGFTIMIWSAFLIRVGWGTWLMYNTIQGCYDTGPVQAGVFGAATSIARILLFWLGGLITATRLI